MSAPSRPGDGAGQPKPADDSVRSPFSREVENLIAGWKGLPPDTSRSRRRGTTGIDEAIRRALKGLHIGTEGPLDQLAQRWPAIVGTLLAGRSHPLSIQGTKLMVAAANPVSRSELMMLSRKIVQEVRQIPGCEQVRELHLRAG